MGRFLVRIYLKFCRPIIRSAGRHRVLAIILLLLLAEFSLRATKLPYRIAWLPEYPAYDRMLFYKLGMIFQPRIEYKPGVFCSMQGPRPFFVRCNHARCRGDDPGHGPVVVCLGGSTTWGGGVSDEETYPAQLEKLLRANGKRGRVINMGAPGVSTYYGVRQGMNEALLFNPRVIIIAYGGLNDSFRVHFRDETLRATSPAFMLLRSFCLYRLIEHSVYRFILFPKRTMRVPTAQYGQNLTSMVEYFRDRGIQVVFLAEGHCRAPQHAIFDSDCMAQQIAEMKHQAARMNVPIVDSAQCLGGAAASFYVDSFHWSARGNEKIAACLAEAIINGSLLK